MIDPALLSLLSGSENPPEDASIPLIPLQPGGKIPIIKSWKQYQEKPPTYATVKNWEKIYNSPNWGLITGRTSGIVVIDIDDWDQAIEWINFNGGVPKTVTVTTSGPNKRHLYFRWPGKHVSNTAKKWPGCDFRGDGGYVVTVGSVHKNGAKYQWLSSPEKTPLANLPDWIIDLVTNNSNHLPKNQNSPDNLLEAFRSSSYQQRMIDALAAGVAEGQRNQTAFCLALYLLDHKIKPGDLLDVITYWNSKNIPPMDHREVVTVTTSAINYWNNKQNQAEKIAAPQPTESALELLSQFVGLKITKVAIEKDDTRQIIVSAEHQERGTLISKHQKVVNYRDWAVQFAQHTSILPHLPDKITSKLNHEFLRLFYAASEIIDIPEEATIEGLVKRVFSNLVEQAACIEDFNEAPLDYGIYGETIAMPFIISNKVYIQRGTFRKALDRYTRDKITDREINKIAFNLGWTMARIQFNSERNAFYTRKVSERELSWLSANREKNQG